MSLNLNIDIDFGGLIEAVKDLIRGNREKLRSKEDESKTESKTKNAINTKSERNKTTYPSVQPPGFPTSVKVDDNGKIPAQKTGYVNANERYRAARPGGSKTDKSDPGIGNAWVWSTADIYAITPTGNDTGAYGIFYDRYIYSLDGTNSIQYHMEFQAPYPTDLDVPLPLPPGEPIGQPLLDHDYGLNGDLLVGDNVKGLSHMYALPVGPKSMVLIDIVNIACVIIPTKRTYYGSIYDPVVNVYAYLSGTYDYLEAKAFFVSESTVKEITLPVSLKDKLVAVAPTYKAEVKYQNICYVSNDNNYWNGQSLCLDVPRPDIKFVNATNPQTWVYDGKKSLGFLDNQDIFADIDVPGGLNPDFKFTTYTAAMYPLLDYGSSWQLDLLDQEASTVQSKAVTIRPSNTGAFADMASYERESLYAAAGNLNYEYNARTVSLKVSPEKLLPPAPYDYARGSGDFGTANYDLEFYISYDWMNTKFCKKRLLALGFSSSDLEP